MVHVQTATRAAFGSRHGVSPRTVYAWAAAGHIVLGDDGKITVAQSDAKLQAAGLGRFRVRRDAGAALSSVAADLKKLRFLAALRQCEADRITALHVPAAHARRTLGAAFAAVRHAVMEMVSPLAARIAACTTPAAVQAVLQDHIHGVLAELTAQPQAPPMAAQKPPAPTDWTAAEASRVLKNANASKRAAEFDIATGVVIPISLSAARVETAYATTRTALLAIVGERPVELLRLAPDAAAIGARLESLLGDALAPLDVAAVLAGLAGDQL